MSSTFRIKRRVSGAPGAPATLLSGELAYNMADGKTYVGKGDNGSGVATSVVAVFGEGFVENLPARGTSLQVLRVKSDGSGLEYATLSLGNTYTAGAGLVLNSLQFSVDFGTVAALASPALSGTPTAPTPGTSDDSTKIATTAFVKAVLAQLIGTAPANLDTLQEIATQLANDESTVAALTTTVAAKLAKASNLADLADVAAARGNLGLASMALQAANNVAITGGTIDGVNLDGGTF